MAMKCIDQMLLPMATAAMSSQTCRSPPPWPRTRRNRSSAVQEPNTATTTDSTAKMARWS